MNRNLSTALALSLTLAAPPAAAAAAETFDLVIAGGRIVDGTGAPWFTGDVAVSGGKIAAIGKVTGPATRRIDAAGLVVAPGFIDLLGQSEYYVLVDPRAASKVFQGITTEVTGEGDSIAPLDDKLISENQDIYKKYGVVPDWRTMDQYLTGLERRGAAINLGTFIGSGSLRAMVIGRQN